MLGKMIIHAFAAAVLIGSAAAVYAQTKDSAPPPPAAQDSRDGYIRPGAEGQWNVGRDERHEKRADAKRGHSDRNHGDDEDDD